MVNVAATTATIIKINNVCSSTNESENTGALILKKPLLHRNIGKQKEDW
jgi:hypothetical protein